MNHKRQTSTFLFGLLLVLFFPSFVLGQIKNYSGAYQIENYIGQADYNYYVVEKDTLLDGTFKMYRSNLDQLINKEDSSFLIQGNFKDNYAVGNWLFQFGEFKSDKISELVDFQYRVNINGIQEEAKGDLENGKPNGLWLYSVNKIKNSEIEKTIFKSSIEFNRGVPYKNFSIENEQNTLVGRFLRNGLAHDQWSLFSSSAMGADEDWNFSDGILKNIQINDSRDKRIPIYTQTYKNTKTITLDKRYLKAIQLQIALNGSDTLYHGNIEELLAQNNAYYTKIDGILSKLGNNNFMPELKVKVPYYPLDSIATKTIHAINTHYTNATKISKSLAENTQLNILKLSDSEIFYWYNLATTISTEFVQPLHQLTTYNSEEILEFVSRKALLKSIWKNKIRSSKISAANKINDSSSVKAFERPSQQPFNFNKNLNLDNVKQMASYTENSLRYIQDKILKKLTKEERQKELITIEEKLLSQNNTLASYIDSTNAVISKKYVPALAIIKKKSEEQLSSYAGIKDKALKVTKGEAILKCNKSYYLLATSIAQIPQQIDSVKKTYVDKIWNPFTATLMNDEVKKQITNAYEKVVIPHFLEEVENNLDCLQAEQLITQIKTTNTNVLALRNKDTHKLERKLKREQDPKVIMEMFKANTKNRDH